MVIVESTIDIDMEVVKTIVDEHELEKYISDKVNDDLCGKMEDQLNEMSLLDIEPTDEGFSVKASVVICPVSEIHTTIQIMAQRLADEHGLSTADIEDILSELTKEREGF